MGVIFKNRWLKYLNEYLSILKNESLSKNEKF